MRRNAHPIRNGHAFRSGYLPQRQVFRPGVRYLPTSGTANRWRLIRGGREVRVRMEGQLLLNTIDLIIDAAIDGHGLAYLPYDQVERAIKEKKLIRVLDKFTPDLPGYHLYYPHRRHAGSAFSLFIDRLKYKGAV